MTWADILPWLGLAGTVGGAGLGAYVAVRENLARLGERVDAALDLAKSAHARLDAHLMARGAD